MVGPPIPRTGMYPSGPLHIDPMHSLSLDSDSYSVSVPEYGVGCMYEDLWSAPPHHGTGMYPPNPRDRYTFVQVYLPLVVYGLAIYLIHQLPHVWEMLS